MAAGAAKENTILEQVGQQEEMLRALLQKIDNLVERNPKPDMAESGKGTREDNIFDEITNILSRCRGLIIEADEKILNGISQKVQS